MKTLLTLAFAFMAFLPRAYAMEDVAQDVMAKDEMMAEMPAPMLKAVVFYSDSCGSCKILEPEMMKAMKAVNMDAVEVIKLDFSSKEIIEKTKVLAVDKGVEPILQQFGAKTGFVAIVNSNGEIVDKLTVTDTAADIAAKMTKAIINAS